jgi:hypothetical protein
MSIGASGNVLINTTTDAGYKLDVNGTGRVNGLMTVGSIQVGTSSSGFYSPTTNQLAGYVGGSEKFRLVANGNFIIGSLTDAGYKLDVNGTARFVGAATNGTSAIVGSFLNGSIGIGNLSGGYVESLFVGSSTSGSVSYSLKNNSSFQTYYALYNSAEGGSFFGTSRNNSLGLINANAARFFIGNINATDILIGTNNIERLRVKSTGQIKFIPLTAAPTGAEKGDVYFNSTLNKLQVYSGTSWETITSL